jgi:dipeptidyl aminopeptidase/acylaminoacyl peptidase
VSARRFTAYGAWPSPLDAGQVAAGSLRLGLPRVDGDDVYWLEGRPTEGGRQVVVRSAPGGAPEDVTPAGWNVRSTVHEYGGGDYLVQGGSLFFVAHREDGIWRRTGAGPEPVAGTLPGARYADFALSPDARWLVAVEEEPQDEERPGGEPANRLVAFDLVAGQRLVVDGRSDFVSSPCFARDGRRLAWLSWDHPNMPWDGTRLWLARFAAAGPAGEPSAVAGGAAESIFQPGFSPAGVLSFVSDRSGWWNLHQLRQGKIVAPAPLAAEFGVPQWQLGSRTWGFLDERSVLCAVRSGGFDRLARLDLASGGLDELALPYTSLDGLHVGPRRAVFLGAGPRTPLALCALDVGDGRVHELRRAFELPLEAGFVAAAEAIEFASADGERVHAFLYRPTHPACAGAPGERPPLLVKSHGGPTAAAWPGLTPGIQYWTSRGFAVVDVDYRGSSGYGRAYRERLRGEWGRLDVDDCTGAALHLAGQGLADPARLTISGGSAGGFTTLCALTFRDAFAAGCSRYGIGDLEALARDTHKFESRYLDALVGPWPERRDLYRERSPIHHVERLARPVIFFQGLEDRVVPPAQAEAMVAALRARGIRHAYVSFPDEQHGFRRAESVRTCLEGELFFYGAVLGFDPGVHPPGVTLRPEAAPGIG